MELVVILKLWISSHSGNKDFISPGVPLIKAWLVRIVLKGLLVTFGIYLIRAVVFNWSQSILSQLG